MASTSGPLPGQLNGAREQRRGCKAGSSVTVNKKKQIRRPQPGPPPYDEVTACREAGLYDPGMPADEKVWKLWRIRRERMKEKRRYGEGNEFEYSDAAETDDESKPLEHLLSPIEHFPNSTEPDDEPQVIGRIALDHPAAMAKRYSPSVAPKAAKRRSGRSRADLSKSAESAVQNFARIHGLSQQETELVREDMIHHQDLMRAAGLEPDFDEAVKEAGLDDPALSETERERGKDWLMFQRKLAMDHARNLGISLETHGSAGLCVPIPYSAHMCRPPTVSTDTKAPRPVLTLDLGKTAPSVGSSSSSVSESASTPPTSAASTSSYNKPKPTPSSILKAEGSAVMKAISLERRSLRSEEDRYYADLVAAIRCQALFEPSLEKILKTVILKIYSEVFTRGPCPPPISGIYGRPIDCNESPEKHSRAAEAFAHKIWSISDPYTIKAGLWGLKEDEVFVLRMIVFVRCVAGWYKMDLQHGIVIEEHEGKGKEKSRWW